MLAAQLLDHLSAAGVRLELQGGRLRAGPSAALTPGLRGLIADHKGALVAMLAGADREPDHAPAALSDEARALLASHKKVLARLLEPDAPAVRWLVTLADGEQFILRATPPCTRAEVEARHPGALVEVEQDPAPAVALVSCRTCDHWRRDLVGDGSGLGRCLASAPASKRPGSCWPRGSIVCRDHREATP